MAAANIFKYTLLSIFIICGTKMLFFIKESNENYTNQLPYDDIGYNSFMKTNFSFFQKYKDSDVIKNKPEIIETAMQKRNIKEDNTENGIKNINSTLSNNLKRKRKLLSQLWDKYYKVKERPMFDVSNKTNTSFCLVGNDIYVYSVFYDDRKFVKDNNNPFLQIVSISKLQSQSTLLCKFPTRTDSLLVTAAKHELSDNHGKLFGGVLYTCNIPHTFGKAPPKTVHLQSQITHDNNLSKVTSTLVSLEVIWIEMSNWESAIYQNENNLKKSLTGNLDKDTMNNFLETFPNSNALRKNQTIDHSQKSSLEIDQGRQLDIRRVKNDEELPRNRKLLSISVCVPPLFGNIKLSEFIQFVEIHKILGVDKIFFYKMNISSDIEQMLNYYQSRGTVIVNDWVLPHGFQDFKDIWYNGQTAAQQDCLYRNIEQYDYTAFLDLDEVIVPKTATTLQQMLAKLDKSYSDHKHINAAGYLFKSAFFESDNTLNEETNSKREKLSFLEKSYRNEIVSAMRSKVIVKSAFIEFTGIHHVSKFVKTEIKLKTIDVPVSTALIHHYRKCTEALDTEMHCGRYMADDSLLKYSDMLKKNYEAALDSNMKYFKTIR